MMKIEIQRLRNLTTGWLHTDVTTLKLDLARILGKKDLSPHMLPGAMHAVEPWLRERVPEPEFWKDEYDPDHAGMYELPDPTDDERREMMKRWPG